MAEPTALQLHIREAKAARKDLRDRQRRERDALTEVYRDARSRLVIPRGTSDKDRAKIERQRGKLERRYGATRAKVTKRHAAEKEKLERWDRLQRKKIKRQKQPTKKRRICRSPFTPGPGRPTAEDVKCLLDRGDLTLAQAKRQLGRVRSNRRTDARTQRTRANAERAALLAAYAGCEDQAEDLVEQAAQRIDPRKSAQAKRASQTARERTSERIDRIRQNLESTPGALAAFDALGARRQASYKGTDRKKPYEQFLEEFAENPDLQRYAETQAETEDFDKAYADYLENNRRDEIPF